jgi:hypothetical protein
VCFSASASFIAAATTGTLGAATLRNTRTPAEIPLAATPLLFGIQQFIEGVVWLSFQRPDATAWNPVATYAYSLFSHVLWPTFVPMAVFLIETDPSRRRLLLRLVELGAVVSLYLAFFIVHDPVTSEVVRHSIRYEYHHHFPRLTMALYLIAVCVSCLLSSLPVLRFFGLALAVSFGVAYWLFTATFFSVWCFFGAALSVVLYLAFRQRNGGSRLSWGARRSP